MTSDPEKIEYEPRDEPDFEEDDYRVHVYENPETVVPDIIIWTREGDERFQLWGFQGHNGLLVAVLQTIHRHPPDYDDDADCEKWSIYQDDPFPPLEDAPETPDDVIQIAHDVSDAPLADKSRGSTDGDGA